MGAHSNTLASSALSRLTVYFIGRPGALAAPGPLLLELCSGLRDPTIFRREPHSKLERRQPNVNQLRWRGGECRPMITKTVEFFHSTSATSSPDRIVPRIRNGLHRGSRTRIVSIYIRRKPHSTLTTCALTVRILSCITRQHGICNRARN